MLWTHRDAAAALLQDILQELGKEARHLNLEIKIGMSESRLFEQFLRIGRRLAKGP